MIGSRYLWVYEKVSLLFIFMYEIMLIPPYIDVRVYSSSVTILYHHVHDCDVLDVFIHGLKTETDAYVMHQQSITRIHSYVTAQRKHERSVDARHSCRRWHVSCGCVLNRSRCEVNTIYEIVLIAVVSLLHYFVFGPACKTSGGKAYLATLMIIHTNLNKTDIIYPSSQHLLVKVTDN